MVTGDINPPENHWMKLKGRIVIFRRVFCAISSEEQADYRSERIPTITAMTNSAATINLFRENHDSDSRATFINGAGRSAQSSEESETDTDEAAVEATSSTLVEMPVCFVASPAGGSSDGRAGACACDCDCDCNEEVDFP
jgi:siroheme synthase